MARVASSVATSAKSTRTNTGGTRSVHLAFASTSRFGSTGGSYARFT